MVTTKTVESKWMKDNEKTAWEKVSVCKPSLGQLEKCPQLPVCLLFWHNLYFLTFVSSLLMLSVSFVKNLDAILIIVPDTEQACVGVTVSAIDAQYCMCVCVTDSVTVNEALRRCHQVNEHMHLVHQQISPEGPGQDSSHRTKGTRRRSRKSVDKEWDQ